MEQRVPGYFDAILQAYHSGRQGRFVHLGHWDDPPPVGTSLFLTDFYDAQLRLNERLLALTELQDRQIVLDVGCGLGGTLQQIDQRYHEMSLVGVNIDPRQLQVCAELATVSGNHFQWHEADACALPFPDAAFDRILCIEAMFHFASRKDFFFEAARVLRPGGILVISDILLRQEQIEEQIPAEEVSMTLDQGYGPWSQPWCCLDELHAMASRSGLLCHHVTDATWQTLPSFRFTTPSNIDLESGGDVDPMTRSGLMLKWLHEQELLQYVYAQYRRDT